MASYAARRRRALLGLGAAGAAMGFGAAWAAESRDAVAQQTTPPTAAPPATGVAADPGELIISGVRGRTASASLLRRAREGEIAGVILMGHSIATKSQVRRLTSALQDAAKAGGQPPLLVMTDQEGGTVRRVASARPGRSARSLASLGVDGVRRQGLGSGQDLLGYGINVNLAPVADVPTNAANFLGTRTFGTTPSAVARNACAFAGGLADAGVVPALKHFPGLGAAGRTNTDDAPTTIRQPLAALEAGWAAYRQCGSGATDTTALATTPAHPGPLTMVASAGYPALTGDATPAVLSSKTYAAARAAGAAGPFITDAMEAGALKGRARVAPRAVDAGAHLVLYTGEPGSALGRRQLKAHLPQAVIDARAAPVRALRASLAD